MLDSKGIIIEGDNINIIQLLHNAFKNSKCYPKNPLLKELVTVVFVYPCKKNQGQLMEESKFLLQGIHLGLKMKENDPPLYRKANTRTIRKTFVQDEMNFFWDKSNFVRDERKR
ncbi:hypothetical protein IEQ34_018544 [Dendrobium chrysotoxum]|uniref:Uncharacterized protein n=1 Tax=Dendrobium chrysotoxum TaxID=161865 RepID=A0AAV7FNP9_DENCH|nr:hypothetical protein IEQ34_018544 [Dendrobium chrysotoxum]